MARSIASPLLPKPGTAVGQYHVLEVIGRGGMAVVYAGARIGEGGFTRLVALKFLAPRLIAEPRFVEMFLDECRIAAHLHHPNVVHVYDVDRYGELPYLVMELLQGVTLAQLQKRCAPMPVGVTARLLAACARGLHAAHEAKGADGHALDVVHRDVCQQNIHVTFDGHVRVVDFGIAAARGKLAETQSGEIKGHFTHLSPEQIGDPKAVDRRADIWALGVMAWECLVGVDLFRDESHSSTLWNVLNKSVPNVRDTRAEVPEELAELIASCLSRDLAGRPSTAQEVAIRLEAIASGLPESDPASLVGLLRHRFTEEIEGAAELGSRAATPVVVADQRLADDAAAIPTSSGAAPLRRLRWTLAIGLVAGATLAGVAGWAATGSSDGPPRIGAEPAAPEDPGVLAAVESPEAAPPDQPTGEIAAAADEGADSPTAPSASAAMEGTSRRQGRRARRRAAPRAEPDEPLGRRSEFLESPYAASE